MALVGLERGVLARVAAALQCCLAGALKEGGLAAAWLRACHHSIVTHPTPSPSNSPPIPTTRKYAADRLHVYVGDTVASIAMRGSSA